MSRPEFIKGEEVVFCPEEKERTSFTRFRGASGIITSRQVGGSKNNKKVRSVLVKWKMHRKGVSCFRVKGQKRSKSDWMTELSKADRSTKLKMWDLPAKEQVLRFEEEAASIHPLSYCEDCPLRLKRLACPCEMTKKVAIETDGQGRDWRNLPNRFGGTRPGLRKLLPHYNPLNPFGI